MTSHPVSQSEKMAIFLPFQTIKFVSFYTEDGEMLQDYFFDFQSKTFGKREQFSIVLKETNGEPSAIEWQILRIFKTGVFPTFGSYCS